MKSGPDKLFSSSADAETAVKGVSTSRWIIYWRVSWNYSSPDLWTRASLMCMRKPFFILLFTVCFIRKCLFISVSRFQLWVFEWKSSSRLRIGRYPVTKVILLRSHWPIFQGPPFSSYACFVIGLESSAMFLNKRRDMMTGCIFSKKKFWQFERGFIFIDEWLQISLITEHQSVFPRCCWTH